MKSNIKGKKGKRRIKWGFGATERKAKKRRITKKPRKEREQLLLSSTNNQDTDNVEGEEMPSDDEIGEDQPSTSGRSEQSETSQSDAEGDLSSDDEIGEDQSSTSDQQGTPPGEPLDGAERGSSSDGDNSLGEGDSEDSSPSGKDGLPDDREEPLSFGLTPEKLFELQILYGKTTKGVHFYEIVMTTALGIQLKKTMTLSKFAEYVVDCTACQTEPGKQFNIILELFGRKLPGVVVSKQNK